MNCELALAIDMTARNMQEAVKKKGLPWTTAKGFDTFTPIGCVELEDVASMLTSTAGPSYPDLLSQTLIT